MTFLYTARGTYDKTYDAEGLSWEKYLEWSKLTHLTELVSLDGMLNELLVEPDHNNTDDWNYIHIVDLFQTGFFTTLEFVLKRMKKMEKFNLLSVVVEPEKECNSINLAGYEFIGYDLLDHDFNMSALTNCGGFDETFLPTDLNDKGLIDDYEEAYDIKHRLVINNPGEHHAETYVIAVWRHLTLGR